DIFENRCGSAANSSRIVVAAIFGLWSSSAFQAGEPVRVDMAGANHAGRLGGITAVVIERELFLLRILAKRYPTVDAAVAELANLEAILTLPKPTVHVVSDVHGEFAKLRQIVANASGSLRPVVEAISPDPDLLDLIYYPRET